MLKAIFHLDEVNKWRLNIENINNLIKELEDDFKIILLVNSDAVSVFKDPKENKMIYDKIKTLGESPGVTIKVCNNALKKFSIKKEGLDDFLEVVPAGVLELILRQDDGYRYLKP